MEREKDFLCVCKEMCKLFRKVFMLSNAVFYPERCERFWKVLESFSNTIFYPKRCEHFRKVFHAFCTLKWLFRQKGASVSGWYFKPVCIQWNGCVRTQIAETFPVSVRRVADLRARFPFLCTAAGTMITIGGSLSVGLALSRGLLSACRVSDCLADPTGAFLWD